MPAVSDRKLAANRANAQKSTGPKTVEGKARVRNNAIRHGLRAEQVVLPWEDKAAYEEMRLTWIDEWKPPTDARRLLVELATAQAWVVRRGLVQQRDRLSDLGNDAVEEYDRRTGARMDKGVELLAVAPPRAIKILAAHPTGVAILIGHWSRLQDALEAAPDWLDPDRHHGRLMNLLGHLADVPPNEVGAVATASWSLILHNDPSQLAPGDPEVGADEAEEAAGLLRRVVAIMIRKLDDSLETLPDFAARRVEVADRAAFDPSKEGLIRLRYMGHHERSFRATLNQLIQVTRSGVDVVADEPESTEVVATDELTLPTPDAPNKATEAAATPIPDAPNKATEAVAAPRVVAPNKATEPTPARVVDAPNKATDPDPSRASTRDREGRTWPIMGRPDGPDGAETVRIDEEECREDESGT